MPRLFSCDMHDRAMVVFADHHCPLCEFMRAIQEEKEHMKDAMDCLDTDTLATELHEVADKIMVAMEKLRK